MMRPVEILHNAKRSTALTIFPILLVSLLAAGGASTAAAWQPDKAECIAPANPGGGWDAICRTISATLQKTGLLKTSMYVTNMPGGSGAVAIANVVTKRKGDTGLLVAASNSLTFTMAAKRTPHTYDDVIPLAQIAGEYGGFWVNSDSKYKSLKDLITALKADPKSVTFAGGSAPGSLDHIKIAILAKAIGVDPTKVVYVPFQGGGEALTALLGGHVNVAAMDISEAAAQLEAGKIRGLALMSDKRSVKFKEVPTTYEQGVKVTFPVWRGLYLPPGTPPDAVKYWTETIDKVLASPEWKAECGKLGWEPVQLTGEEFKKFVRSELTQYQTLLKELGFAN